MKFLLKGLIKLYQKFISPIKKPCCRFYPSCSSYALEALTIRGLFPALILIVWRLLRCNPFGKPGYDPVPKTGFRNKPASVIQCKINRCEIIKKEG